MDKADLDALISELEYEGHELTADDVEYLASYLDPLVAKQEWLSGGSWQGEALTAAQRNI